MRPAGAWLDSRLRKVRQVWANLAARLEAASLPAWSAALAAQAVLAGSLLVAVACLIVALIGWAAEPGRGAAPSTLPVAMAVSPARSPAPLPTAKDARPATSAKPESERVPTRAVEPGPYRLEPPYIVLDGLTFMPENAQPTRVAGVVGPASEAICLDPEQRLWACGLQARAALSRLITKRSVECRPDGAAGGGARVVAASCRVEGEDLAAALVDQGFARAADPQSPLARRESAARQGQLGLWNGGWRIR